MEDSTSNSKTEKSLFYKIKRGTALEADKKQYPKISGRLHLPLQETEDERQIQLEKNRLYKHYKRGTATETDKIQLVNLTGKEDVPSRRINKS